MRIQPVGLYIYDYILLHAHIKRGYVITYVTSLGVVSNI